MRNQRVDRAFYFEIMAEDKMYVTHESLAQ